MALKTIRLQLRFLLPLLATLVGASYLAVPLMDQVTLRWFSRDLNSRGMLLTNALSDSVAEALASGRTAKLRTLFDRTAQDERLFAIGLCSPDGQLLQSTDRFPASLSCDAAIDLARLPEPRLSLPGGPVHVGVQSIMGHAPAPATAAEGGPLTSGPPDLADVPASTSLPLLPAGARPAPTGPMLAGQLVLLHDMSFIDRRSQDTRRYLIGLITALGLVIAVITMAVAQLSWRGWVKGVQAIMRGEGLLSPLLPPPELAPFADDLRARLRDLEDEYRRAQGPEAEWTADRLRSLLNSQLSGDQVIVVSNREPYIHERDKAGQLIVKQPASGLVTAVEPVMRACSGTWVAHGSGGADREAVDASDRVLVPPGHDDYWLRRIWLTAEEEQGYYYGFANEGMWPLCHVAHVRPVFRESDWEAYRKVNQRFADAVIAEARSEDPVVLVQDYHFALLPAMIREKLPQATILTFWHIPWPNPESFGICPWRREILTGMLGSTILGFHTRFHCKNFIETVDRYLEARIEHEHSTIAFHEKETLVESYPISIEWPPAAETSAWAPVAECRRRVIERLGLPPDVCLAVGVDRFDYTKGILERLNAVERLLEKWPDWIGRFVFVQVAAPTRSSLDEYRSFQERVQRVTERINQRFGRAGYQPVHLLAQHHEHDAVMELLRAANVCVVTSLHDGMNLVCKEFVAARDDLQGVLVLSRFAGAARELSEALIVNPYHVEETADALNRAATMPAGEQRERMASLRSTVREFNVFRWAGRMLADAGRWRLRARIEARVRRHAG
ncbi:trehalose-6-phosphate synthase [Aquabacterium sp.]|uniref:trehalose-6-phosphate synthase n=1 Tax=Aquabacterium sp. TaxID=1872578 RepID=UPI002CDA4842|nr:trehalose-6-phosphate synthase [Aquabacterium sp.]HSW04635.1 trehalose-6-phosphate synthase [Aquabacterium sp.]